MSDALATSSSSSPPKLSLLRRLFSWRMARRCLIGLAVLVTLFALFHAEENWRGQRAWNKYRAEMEAKGAIFDLKAIVPPPVPDDQNFAMTPLLKPLLDLNSPGSPERFRDTNGFQRVSAVTYGDATAQVKNPSYSGNWFAGNQTDLAGWQKHYQSSTNFPQAPASATPAEAVLKALSRYDAEFAELREASQRPHSRFNIGYTEDNPLGILLPHLAVVKNLTSVAGLRAKAFLANGEPDKALADVELMFRLADSIKDEPVLISYLVRLACQTIALQPIWEGLEEHRWKPEHRARLQTRLESMDGIAEVKRALKGERAFGNGAIEWLIRNPAMLRDIAHGDSGKPSEPLPGMMLFPKGWFRFEQVNYNRMFDEHILAALTDRADEFDFAKLRSRMTSFDEEMKRQGPPLTAIFGHHVLSRLLLPALHKTSERGVQSHAMIQLARVALALEAHRLAKGNYPETLDSLAPEFLKQVPLDPINRQPLRYGRKADGKFKLWSVGWNAKDDGGEVALAKNGQTIDPLAGDWVWPQAKAK